MAVVANLNQTNFTGGEWSELLEGRNDIAKYGNALSRLENFVLWPHGPASFRPGFKYIKATKDSSKASRVIPFEFSVTQAYVLEFGDQYIRFYKDQGIITLTSQNITNITQANPAVVTYSGPDTYSNGDKVLITGVVGMTQVNNREFTVANVNAGNNTFELSGINSTGYDAYTSGGSVSEIYGISSPYLEADLMEIKFCQSADVLYLFHPDYAPRKLSRTGHTSWTLQTINFNPAPTDELPVEPDTTLTLSAVTGTGITFTAGASTFQNGDIGRLIVSGVGRASITAYTSGTVVTCDIIDDFASVGPIASGDWEMRGSPIGTGNLTPSAKSPKGAIITLTSTVNSFRSTDVGKYVRINSGFVKITSYSSALVVSGEILKELTATTASTTWTLESEVWDSTNGYPSCGTFFEDRLCVARNETVWGSVVGDYENFTPGVDDADAFEFSIGGRQVNIIRWLEPREYLILGTVGSEWRLGPEDTGSPITPTNVVAKQQTTYGCANLQPVTISQATLFVQRQGRKIREFTFKWETDGYVAPDLTLLAEHITEGGIVDIAFQQEPLSIVWVVRDDGTLIGLTYLRDEDVIGWHSHPIDGEVESIAVIPGNGYDELWAVIKRTINGGTVRYIEMMEAVFNDDSDTYDTNKGLNAFFVDCGYTYNSTSTATISGLNWLEGEEVAILSDGGSHPNRTVTNGKITLQRAATVVHVGIPYEGILQTLDMNLNLAGGTAQGKKRRIISVKPRVYRSGTFKIGRDENSLKVAKFRPSSTPMGSPSLYTGYVDDTLSPAKHDTEAKLMIAQDKPMPLTVVAIIPKVEVSEN